jgi:hypothetical protein
MLEQKYLSIAFLYCLEFSLLLLLFLILLLLFPNAHSASYPRDRPTRSSRVKTAGA